MTNVNNSFTALKSYCEAQNFMGWDPYDGLNSKIFQATPLKHWDLARWGWIQIFKRSPINFRSIVGVPKQYNSKGLGLLLNGYCNLYELSDDPDKGADSKKSLLKKIKFLADLLVERGNRPEYSGSCWGYNFDWQARQLFLFPKETPTVVATTFCASALFHVYEITKDQIYLKTALSSADFILKDLNRTPAKDGFILSYSPLKGNNTVYNASLLGAKTLSLCYHYTKKEIYKQTAIQIIKAACQGQNEDGSWIYGLLPIQSWIDSFHTGYNLDAIKHYSIYCEDSQFDKHIDKGFEFYIQNFFLDDGTPKYYHDKTYPIDIHCPAQLWVTLDTVGKWEENKVIAKKVMDWTIDNMQDKKGYFYYQLKKGISSKISYMRWSNAFMFNAMSTYLKHQQKL